MRRREVHASEPAPIDRLAESGVEGPAWLDGVGTADATRAWIVREDPFDDSSVLFVEFEIEHGRRHVMAVFVDHNLGGAVSGVHVGPSLDEVVALTARDPDGPMRPEPVRLDEMAARLRRALSLTPPELRSQVSGGIDNLYALALRRAEKLPDGTVLPELPELGPEERFALLDGFLRSPEGSGVRGDTEGQAIIARAIDFCADYVDGRPLRWSPTVVGSPPSTNGSTTWPRWLRTAAPARPSSRSGAA